MAATVSMVPSAPIPSICLRIVSHARTMVNPTYNPSRGFIRQYGGQAEGGIMAGGGSIGVMPPTKDITLGKISRILPSPIY